MQKLADEYPKCPVLDCDWTKKLNGGLCPAHYRQKSQGRPFSKVIRFNSVEERFWSKVDRRGEDDCWTWLGCLTSTGYGQFASRQKPEIGRKAHRHAYFYTHGKLSPDKSLDHICGNRTCVNPFHLREVDVLLNAQNLNLRANNKSGYRGVSWNSRRKLWSARVNYNGKNVYNEHFENLEDAAEAARLKRLEVFTHNERDK